MSSNVYEMLWDCKYCGTEKLLGLTHRFCPNCGAAQDPDTRYFPSDEEKVAVKDHVYHGVDVTCAACGELNSAIAEFCGQCGSPLTDAARARTLEAQTREAGEVFASSGSRDLEKEEFDSEMRRVGLQEKPKNKPSGRVRWGAIAVALLVLVGGVFFLLNWTTDAEVIVSGHEWERNIVIDSYQSFSTRAWEDNQPIGFEVTKTDCRREQRSTKRVPDGETCRTRRVDQGDGTYREEEQCTTKYREEPVYDDKCLFSGYHWEYERTVATSGGLNDTPYWGDVSLSCEGMHRLGCEVENSRNEAYRVLYDALENEETYTCEYDQAEWGAIPVEAVYVGSVRVVDNSSLLCDTLVPAN